MQRGLYALSSECIDTGRGPGTGCGPRMGERESCTPFPCPRVQQSGTRASRPQSRRVERLSGVPDLIYRGGGGLVLFDATVVRALQRWRQIGAASEAGGILLGYRRDPHLHVVAVTEPGKSDRRHRYAFLRRDGAHQAAALALWTRTQATGYYLGEWHTHAEAVPTPSPLDQREWAKLMQGAVEADLLFLIVGRDGWFLQRGRSSCMHS